MNKLKLEENKEDIEFYISIQDGKNSYLVYTSEPFIISEIDLISLIKVCLVRRRNKIIGNKLLEIYKDSTLKRQKLTNQRLNAIGIKENEKPETTKRTNPRTK